MSSEPSPAVTIITPRGKLIALTVICALFAAMGAVVLALGPTEPLNLVVGVAALAFFGIGGGISVVTQWRRSTVLRADDAGLRISGSGPVPWGDVDRVGATGSVLGVRLRRTETYLAGAPRDVTAESLRTARAETGWDISWPAAVLDRPPRDAAAAVNARRPH